MTSLHDEFAAARERIGRPKAEPEPMDVCPTCRRSMDGSIEVEFQLTGPEVDEFKARWAADPPLAPTGDDAA